MYPYLALLDFFLFLFSSFLSSLFPSLVQNISVVTDKLEAAFLCPPTSISRCHCTCPSFYVERQPPSKRDDVIHVRTGGYYFILFTIRSRKVLTTCCSLFMNSVRTLQTRTGKSSVVVEGRRLVNLYCNKLNYGRERNLFH